MSVASSTKGSLHYYMYVVHCFSVCKLQKGISHNYYSTIVHLLKNNETEMPLWLESPRASPGVQLDVDVRQLQYTCSLGVVQSVLLMYNF